jgi:hypothetical protein
MYIYAPDEQGMHSGLVCMGTQVVWFAELEERAVGLARNGWKNVNVGRRLGIQLYRLRVLWLREGKGGRLVQLG